jgi:hypothetical protein
MARGDNTAEMKFRLPGELHAQIEASASANGRSASEEVRRRLEASFEGAPPASGDAKTGELLALIATIAREIGEIYGKPWHEDAWVRDALLGAIPMLVKAKAQRGEAKFDPMPEAIAELAWGENEREPSIAGRMYALARLADFARSKR